MKEQPSSITPYLLLIALGLHGVNIKITYNLVKKNIKIKKKKFFEGMTIGLQKKISPLFNLVLAISLHKWAEALTIVYRFFIINLLYMMN